MSDALIEKAAAILRDGGLVAFPTETVYGLGADATNSDAVRKIFAAKGRPATNPLIAHVASIEIARRCAKYWDDRAEKLANAFWPGPLTLVVERADRGGDGIHVVDEATAGLNTVGVRVPSHPMALELLAAFGGAVVAPSANRSTRTSPTRARWVEEDLGHAVNLVLDGGSCQVGIESTVLSLCGTIPRILRPGAVTREMIEDVVGGVEAIGIVNDVAIAAMSPGQHLVHYAPLTPAFRFDPADREKLDLSDAAIIEITLHPETYARNLYARLRLLDSQRLRAIYIEMPPDQPGWVALRDRISRATRPLSEDDTSRS